MAINVEMSIKQADNNYETLYPKTLGSLVDGKVSSASVADSAINATSADSANIANDLNGILSVSKGGTGVNNLNSLKSSLKYNIILENDNDTLMSYVGDGQNSRKISIPSIGDNYFGIDITMSNNQSTTVNGVTGYVSSWHIGDTDNIGLSWLYDTSNKVYYFYSVKGTSFGISFFDISTHTLMVTKNFNLNNITYFVQFVNFVIN